MFLEKLSKTFKTFTFLFCLFKESVVQFHCRLAHRIIWPYIFLTKGVFSKHLLTNRCKYFIQSVQSEIILIKSVNIGNMKGEHDNEKETHSFVQCHVGY
jgi:hypothetical protein